MNSEASGNVFNDICSEALSICCDESCKLDFGLMVTFACEACTQRLWSQSMTPPRSREIPAEVQEWLRARKRRTLKGFGIGIICAAIETVVFCAIWGLQYLGASLSIFILLPIAFSITGFRYVRACPRVRPRLTIRLSTGDMMIAVAYIALLLGIGLTVVPIGRRALDYKYQESLAQFRTETFLSSADQAADEAKDTARIVTELRARRIPEGLPAHLQESLQKLESPASRSKNDFPPNAPAGLEPSLRKLFDRREEVYKRVLSVYEPILQSKIEQATYYLRMFEYYESMVVKYRVAKQNPWVPVAPDPPAPQRPVDLFKATPPLVPTGPRTILHR